MGVYKSFQARPLSASGGKGQESLLTSARKRTRVACKKGKLTATRKKQADGKKVVPYYIIYKRREKQELSVRESGPDSLLQKLISILQWFHFVRLCICTISYNTLTFLKVIPTIRLKENQGGKRCFGATAVLLNISTQTGLNSLPGGR
jgi:hypothetical protein